MVDKVLWPSWRYGPKGEADIFERPEDVPVGWFDHPSMHGAQAAPIVDDPDTASREEVISALKARGIAFDGRWSMKRLQGLLA